MRLAGILLAATLLAPLSVAAQSAKPPAESAEEHSGFARARGGDKVFYPADHFDLSGLPAYRPEKRVSGTLRLWGNNYIGDSPLGRWWADAFRKYHPGVTIEYRLPSAAIAAPALYFDLADIGMNHEPSFYDYLAFSRIKGFEPTVISVVTGSYNLPGWQNTMVIAVNRDNPITQLSMRDLDGIFGSVRDGGWVGATWHPEFSRGPEANIRSWGQLGLTGAWATRHIDVYGYTPRYATALEFSNKVLQGSDKWNEDLRAFGNARRPDGTIYGQAEQIIDRLAADPDGIGIIRYTDAVGKRLKVVALAPRAGAAPVPYTLETVQDRTYPLWGDQSLILAARPGQPVDPKIREFVRFILSREGQALVARDGKYLPLTAAAARESLAKLDKAGK